MSDISPWPSEFICDDPIEILRMRLQKVKGGPQSDFFGVNVVIIAKGKVAQFWRQRQAWIVDKPHPAREVSNQPITNRVKARSPKSNDDNEIFHFAEGKDSNVTWIFISYIIKGAPR
jgi:hypothetical protein